MTNILSARFSSPAGDAVIAVTADSGEVLITQSPGKAAKWAALQDWIKKGGQVAAFVPAQRNMPRDPLAELDKLRAALVAKNVIDSSDDDMDPIVRASDENAKEMGIG